MRALQKALVPVPSTKRASLIRCLSYISSARPAAPPFLPKASTGPPSQAASSCSLPDSQGDWKEPFQRSPILPHMDPSFSSASLPPLPAKPFTKNPLESIKSYMEVSNKVHPESSSPVLIPSFQPQVDTTYSVMLCNLPHTAQSQDVYAFLSRALDDDRDLPTFSFVTSPLADPSVPRTVVVYARDVVQFEQLLALLPRNGPSSANPFDLIPPASPPLPQWRQIGGRTIYAHDPQPKKSKWRSLERTKDRFVDEDGYHFLLSGVSTTFGLAKVRRVLNRFCQWEGDLEGSRIRALGPEDAPSRPYHVILPIRAVLLQPVFDQLFQSSTTVFQPRSEHPSEGYLSSNGPIWLSNTNPIELNILERSLSPHRTSVRPPVLRVELRAEDNQPRSSSISAATSSDRNFRPVRPPETYQDWWKPSFQSLKALSYLQNLSFLTSFSLSSLSTRIASPGFSSSSSSAQFGKGVSRSYWKHHVYRRDRFNLERSAPAWRRTYLPIYSALLLPLVPASLLSAQNHSFTDLYPVSSVHAYPPALESYVKPHLNRVAVEKKKNCEAARVVVSGLPHSLQEGELVRWMKAQRLGDWLQIIRREPTKDRIKSFWSAARLLGGSEQAEPSKGKEAGKTEGWLGDGLTSASVFKLTQNTSRTTSDFLIILPTKNEAFRLARALDDAEFRFSKQNYTIYKLRARVWHV
ncbi:hypothetical protein [Phaffia rhodozyma]|uniref:Uncharacterized protein n=1 Tax=Phaffia rhodozyma TaxID=264483 RepID=A0A0F7SKC1_PHARH|nr:hypothetical protein [Phaffia rhodozyma]